MKQNFYDFKANSLQGKKICMDTYKSKVVLVVNTASKCGLTPQYEGLEELYKEFKEQGLVILGFPCNQFAGQEPGGEKEIAEGCLINYGVTFPMFAKVNVNGSDAHPIYQYLKKELKGFPGSELKWNFTKFMLDREGKPFKRYSPTTTPAKLRDDIVKLLG